MTETLESLRHTLDHANELRSIVRMVKAASAMNLVLHQRALEALDAYERAIQLGLRCCLRGRRPPAPHRDAPSANLWVVFGTDQGLVGRFNEAVAERALDKLRGAPAATRVWAVGSRVADRLHEAGCTLEATLRTPSSIDTLAPLLAELARVLVAADHTGNAPLWIAHNRPASARNWEPVVTRVLPIDTASLYEQASQRWPSNVLPAPMSARSPTLAALLREALTLSIYRAAAESIASENTSRLSMMERADHNIGDMLEAVGGRYHALRQSSIDGELFDLVAGYEALSSADEREETRTTAAPRTPRLRSINASPSASKG